MIAPFPADPPPAGPRLDEVTPCRVFFILGGAVVPNLGAPAPAPSAGPSIRGWLRGRSGWGPEHHVRKFLPGGLGAFQAPGCRPLIHRPISAAAWGYARRQAIFPPVGPFPPRVDVPFAIIETQAALPEWRRPRPTATLCPGRPERAPVRCGRSRRSPPYLTRRSLRKETSGTGRRARSLLNPLPRKAAAAPCPVLALNLPANSSPASARGDRKSVRMSVTMAGRSSPVRDGMCRYLSHRGSLNADIIRGHSP